MPRKTAQPMKNETVEKPILETPVEEPILDTPVEEPILETPVEEPILETPVEDTVEITSTVLDAETPTGNGEAVRLPYHAIMALRLEKPYLRFFANKDQVVLVPLDYEGTGYAGFYTTTAHEALGTMDLVNEIIASTGYHFVGTMDGEHSHGRFAIFRAS